MGSPCLTPSLCCQVATQDLVVVLNKVDLLPAEARPKLVAKAKKRLAQTLSATKFAGCHMVAVAAKPGGPGHCDQAHRSAGPWVRRTSGALVQAALPTCHVALGWPSTASSAARVPVDLALKPAWEPQMSYHQQPSQ